MDFLHIASPKTTQDLYLTLTPLNNVKNKGVFKGGNEIKLSLPSFFVHFFRSQSLSVKQTLPIWKGVNLASCRREYLNVGNKRLVCRDHRHLPIESINILSEG